MAAKRVPKAKTASLFPEPKASAASQSSAQPAIPAAAALSFLKDTRGLTTWTAREMATTLQIKPKETSRIIAILELQGYVKSTGKGEWMTTIAGEGVSNSKPPRYTPEKIDAALASLKDRIAETNRDSRAPFKIAEAVAYGDFLSGRARVQAADVGIELVRRTPVGDSPESHKEHVAREEFLKQRLGKTPLVHIRPYEPWMRARTHRAL